MIVSRGSQWQLTSGTLNKLCYRFYDVDKIWFTSRGGATSTVIDSSGEHAQVISQYICTAVNQGIGRRAEDSDDTESTDTDQENTQATPASQQSTQPLSISTANINRSE